MPKGRVSTKRSLTLWRNCEQVDHKKRLCQIYGAIITRAPCASLIWRVAVSSLALAEVLDRDTNTADTADTADAANADSVAWDWTGARALAMDPQSHSRCWRMLRFQLGRPNQEAQNTTRVALQRDGACVCVLGRTM